MKHTTLSFANRLLPIAIWLLLFSSVLTCGAFAGEIKSVQSGVWSATTTWFDGTIPTSTDSVIIELGHTVTLTGSVTVSGLKIYGILDHVASNSSITLNASGSYANEISYHIYGEHKLAGAIIYFNRTTGGPNIQIHGTGIISGTGSLKAVDARMYVASDADLTITDANIVTATSAFQTFFNYGKVHLTNGNFTFENGGYVYNYEGGEITLTNGVWDWSGHSNSTLFNSGNIRMINNDMNIGYFGNIIDNSGDITIENGSMNFGYNSSDKNTITNRSTGTINVLNGGLYTMSTSALRVNNTGIITVWGDIIIKVNSIGTYTNNANSVLNVGGILSVSSLAYFRVFAPNNTVNFFGSGDQTIPSPLPNGNLNKYFNLKCSNSGVKTLSGSLIILGDLTIRDAAQLDASASPYNIDLKGNWYDSSNAADPFVERTGKITFSGDSLQTITALHVPGGESFYDLVINNSDTGIVLKDNINITDTLTLLDGLIHTGTDTLLIMNTDTAAIQSYSDTTYVNGFLKRSISPSGGSYDFPVGNATAYELANVDFVGSDTIATLTVDFSNPANGAGLPLTDANDAEYSTLLKAGGNAPGSGNANAGVWNIHPGKGSAIYDLSLYGRHFDNAGTMYQSIVKRSSNLVPWEFAGTYLPAELKTDTIIARRTCLTDFAEFAIAGSSTITPLNTLPIRFQSNDTLICGSKCIALAGKGLYTPTNWRWTLSGGTFASLHDTSLQNPSGICFNNVGNYNVRLIASTVCRSADTLEKKLYIKVNPIPIAAIAGPMSVCSGTTLSLSASPSGNNYQWSTGESSTSISHSLLTNTTYSLVVSTPFCSDTAYSTIAVTTTPTASINANTTAICSGENVSLTANGAAEFYLWNTAETGTAITVSPLLPVRYWLKLSNGTCSDKDSITINVTTTPAATITTGETSICSGKRIILSAASAIPDVSYLWSNNTTNQNINAIPLTNTTYSVVLSNGNCKDTAAIDINVTTTPTLILTANRSIICSGESVELSATGAGDYLWSTGESGTAITASPLLPLAYSLFTIRYSLKLSNGNCFDLDSILITVVPTPTASISGSLTVCSGNSTRLSANPGDAYLWSTGETTAEIIITPSINTVYSVTVSNGNGLCMDTTSRSITLITPVPANAGPDITMAIGLDTVLSANNGSAWNWTPKVRMDCNTCQNPIVAPFQTTSYTVTVTDINGCISSDSVKVHVIPCAKLFIPEAFSPNNDGQNDVLYIRGTDCIEKVFSFTIFNRWGEKVFETFDIKAGWDGSQTKETLPNEVFIYYLDALSINGDAISKTGNVTLMR